MSVGSLVCTGFVCLYPSSACDFFLFVDGVCWSCLLFFSVEDHHDEHYLSASA